MTYLMEQKWLEMIEAFQKLSPEERLAEAEKRLDEILGKMAQLHNISTQEAYGKLIENRNRSQGEYKMIQDEIAALDDKTAIHILRVIAKSLMRSGTFETSGTPDMANALKSAFEVSEPAEKASEGDIARLTLRWLSDDPKYSANITAMMIGSNTQRFSTDLGTISILIGALVILQTHLKFEKKNGKVSVLIEKKSASDGLLKPLVEKLLSYLP